MFGKTHLGTQLGMGEIRWLCGDNQSEPTRFRNIFLILGTWLWLVSFNIFGQTSESGNDAMPGYTRYLIVVDNTFSMRRFDDLIEKAAINWLDTGLDGRVSGGDGFALWSYSDFGASPLLPTTTWRIRSQDRLLNQSLIALNGIRFFSRNRSEEIFLELQKALQQAIPLSVLWITDGKSEFRGSPFDLDIQKILKDQQPFVSKTKTPVVVTLEAAEGEWQAWAVNRLTLAAPPFLLPAQPAFQPNSDRTPAPAEKNTEENSLSIKESASYLEPELHSETSLKVDTQTKPGSKSPLEEEKTKIETDSNSPGNESDKETQKAQNHSDNKAPGNASQIEEHSLMLNEISSESKSEEPQTIGTSDNDRLLSQIKPAVAPQNSEGMQGQEASEDIISQKVKDPQNQSQSVDPKEASLKVEEEIEATTESQSLKFSQTRQLENGYQTSNALSSAAVKRAPAPIPLSQFNENQSVMKIWPMIFWAFCFLMFSGMIGYFLIHYWKEPNIPNAKKLKPSVLEVIPVKGSLITATMAQDSKKRKKSGSAN